MKVELTDKEKESLQYHMDKNPIRSFLSSKNNFDFEIGDVIVKKRKRYQGKDDYVWVAEPISSENSMPQRYVCIHKDEFGIVYFKQLKVSTGQLGRDIHAITDFDLTFTKFEIDPEYAETTFLESEFSIKDLHKKSLEQRKIVTKMNRKMGVKFKTLEDSNKFFQGMSVNDIFWITTDYTAKYVEECTITEITNTSIHNLETSSDYSWRRFVQQFTVEDRNKIVNAHSTFHIKYNAKDEYYNRSRDSYVFNLGKDMVFYKDKPAQEDKSK